MTQRATNGHRSFGSNSSECQKEVLNRQIVLVVRLNRMLPLAAVDH
jgi:hypothetical protein